MSRLGKKGIYKEWLKPENLILLKGWRRDGATLAQIAENIGIRPPTLSEWIKLYPEIGDALKVGKEYANFRVENKLYLKALSGNVTAMIFWLKNNWRTKYRDIHFAPEEIEQMKANTVLLKKKSDQQEIDNKKAREELQNIILRNKKLQNDLGGSGQEQNMEDIVNLLNSKIRKGTQDGAD